MDFSFFGISRFYMGLYIGNLGIRYLFIRFNIYYEYLCRNEFALGGIWDKGNRRDEDFY